MNYYFITGSSGGIGNALVQELLKFPNNKIIGLSRSNILSEDQFEHVQIDLSSENEVKNFQFQELTDAQKVVLINNAGTLGDIKHVGLQSDENILESVMVNFTAAAVLMNKFIQVYQNLEISKIIVNVSSGAAQSPYDGWANYCSTKAALNMYTEVIHEEQKDHHSPIQAYAIAPGVVDTLMQDSIRKVEKAAFSRIEKFKQLKENDELYKAQDVAKKMIAMINQPSTIPSLISRIRL